MQSLIQGLLIYARVTSRAQPYNIQADLNKVIRGVLSDLEVRIEQTGARIEIEGLGFSLVVVPKNKRRRRKKVVPQDRSTYHTHADDDEDDRLMAAEACAEARLYNTLHFVTDGVELLDHLRG